VAKRASRSFTVTFIAVVVVAAFLSPLLRSFTISLKNARPDQRS
jgi:archaellum component FlaG (FlaF/FlaG flagellin family)